MIFLGKVSIYICTVLCLFCFASGIPVPTRSTTDGYRLDKSGKEWLLRLLSSLSGRDLDGREYSPFLPSERISSNDSIECDVCKTIVGFLIADASSRKVFDDDLLNYMNKGCIEILSSRYNASGMCPNMTKFYGPIIWYSIVNSELSAEKVCQHLYACPKLTKHNSWIPQPIPDPSYSLIKKNKSAKLAKPKSSIIKFIHISDFHLDIDFKKGAPSTCDYFLCCRDSMTGSNPAGTYGAYGCDLPYSTANLVLDHLKTLKDIDFVVYGGDNPPHDLWIETEQSQMNVESIVINMFKQHFPNTPIYPVLGNHESYPESEYFQSLYLNQTKTLAGMWRSWAPFPDTALKTIGLGGYYTLVLKPKLRLIAYNSDYGYLYNFYTMLNHKNPDYAQHTQWILDVLAMARRNAEKVLLVAHVPPGISTSTFEYGEWFINVTLPYSDIIVGQLFGHTHHDHFKVVQQNGKTFGSVLVTPSVTTFAHQNPSFRIYSMDASTYELLDYDQYFLNITKANELAKEGKTPEFEINYSAKDFYGLKDLSAESWLGLANRFKTNSTLFLQYVDNMYARSKVPSCDADCKKRTICQCENASLVEALKCYTD